MQTYYERVIVMERLLRPTGEERAWLLAMPRETPPAPTIVYLGCNVFRTTHLAQTVGLVLKRLDVEHVAVGGPAFCCGSVPAGKISPKVGTAVLSRTERMFDRFEPTTLVNWCPSCERHETREWGADAPFRIEHFTALLQRRLAAEDLRPVPMRVALHTHDSDVPAVRDRDAVRAIFRMIPELEFFDLPSRPGLGYHCSGLALQNDNGQDRLEHVVSDDVAAARDRGATAIASVYHSCHREWIKASTQLAAPMPIVNYISIVAQALGIVPPQDLYARYTARAAAGDLDGMLAELCSRGEELGLAPGAIERVVRSEFAGA